MNGKLHEFLVLLYDQIGRGIYVWGGDGENLSEMSKPVAWIERHETSASNAKRAIALYNERVNDGVSDIRAFDCSGLVYWALHSLGLQSSDVSSRGLYNLCDKIKQNELRMGDLVFHHNGIRIVHVGVYAGYGKYIECRGRDVGVVCNTRKSGYWNRFGRWKAFEDEPTERVVYVKGKSVNVREGDNTKTKVIGIAHKGETYPYIETAPSGWYKIDFKGKAGYISNRADLTEVR